MADQINVFEILAGHIDYVCTYSYSVSMKKQAKYTQFWALRA